MPRVTFFTAQPATRHVHWYGEWREGMLRRLVTVVLLLLTLMAGTSMASASSYGSYSGDYDFGSRTRRSMSDNIWVGLCVGASLDMSRASEKSCQRQQQAAQHADMYPYNSPNIEASLCLGASLNLSRASAASCAAQTASSGLPSNQTHQIKHGYTYNHIDDNQVTTSFQYAALGDSVAAGVGLPGSNNPGDSTCGRSTEAYAYHIAAAHGFDFIHVACIGTTMGNLLTERRGQPAQLDSAFAAGTPQLITITAGANDARWDSILLKCLRSTCGTNSDNRTIQNALTVLQSETQTVLQQIAERSNGSPPKVIITGYYNPISANCTTVEPRITSQEVAWVDSQLAGLNQTLRNATANTSFATFVPIDFAGHDICSSDPWIRNTNDPAPLHPTAAGQQAIAQMILADP